MLGLKKKSYLLRQGKCGISFKEVSPFTDQIYKAIFKYFRSESFLNLFLMTCVQYTIFYPRVFDLHFNLHMYEDV